MTKLEILEDAKKQRSESVESYQLNIDNYTRALAKIEEAADKDDLAEFKADLDLRLKSEGKEQRKEQIMLAVIEDQINELR